MSMSKASSDYFEQVAGEWDNLRSSYFTEAVRDAAIAKAYLRSDMVVADVGAGTGFMAAGLAQLVQRVHVLDGSPAMIEVARHNLSAFTNVEYHSADGQSLPLADGSVDVAFANMYLHHCPDPLSAIREMVRILKPGGRLVITDMDSHPYAWLKEEMADEWQGFEREQMRQWFKALDLVNVLVDCSGQSCCAVPHNPATDTARISVFLATATRRMLMRDAVQESYGALAAAGGCSCSQPKETLPSSAVASCCETTSAQACCSKPSQTLIEETAFIDYSAADKAAVPSEAAQISLGCGNPTALAGLSAGEVVVDIGSGAGMDSFLAARRVGAGGRVIGVDIIPAMLKRARATAQKHAIHNVEFRQGQAEALPVEDQSVDVVLSNCVINLCEDKAQVFQQAYRVLKPGGRLEVSDIVTSGTLPLQARQNRETWAECVSGALPEQEYLDLMAQAGFTQIVTRRSPAAGEADGISVYSITVSARKPAAATEQSAGCDCG